MSLVDTSVWIGRFLEKDVHHAQAKETLAALDDETKHVCHAVIEETTTVLCHKHSKEQADDFLHYILDNKEVVILPHDIDKEATLFRAINTPLSLADVSLISLSRRFDIEIISFDKQLMEVASGS
jgi:predicted nucleic acid-binding protein